MRALSVVFLVFSILLMLIGCSTNPGKDKAGYLSKEQVLEHDPDADILEYDENVYKNGIDWVEREKLTKGEQVGEVSEGMANKLPTNAKIFTTEERKDILIVENNGEEKRYLLQLGE